MSNDLNFYINGEWVKSDSSELIDVINPANEEIIGQVTAGTKKDIDDAVIAACNAFTSFSKSSQNERIELLKKIIQEGCAHSADPPSGNQAANCRFCDRFRALF